MSGCSCAQLGATELDVLDELVNGHGLDQLAASRLLGAIPAAFRDLIDAIAETTAAVDAVTGALGCAS